VEMRLSRVGRNEVCVPIPSIFDALIQEFFQFFYIYQFFIISCYFFDDYISVGTVVLVILLLGGLRQAYLKRTAQIEVKSMVLDESKSDVLRNGIWIKIPSCDLVPGDVVRVRAGKVPCDLAILEGSAVVDEAMLTGESMPVAKVALEKNSNNSFDPDLHKKHALYAGTTILGQDSDSDSKCELLNLGICIRTGVNTSKGSLLCAILSPSNIRLKIDDHLSFALIILFGFAGVLFFVCIFAIFGAKDIYSWFYGIYQIVAVIPILLPSVFLASASSTVSALQKQNIFCTDPSRLMVCGKMRVWCFDKTGTLTKQGLDFVGAMPIKNSFFKSKTTVLEAGDIFTQVMASTHSLSRSEGRLVGTAVDCKMFEGTGWKLGPGPAPIDNKDLNENNWVHEPISGMRLHILKRFDFDHALMTMTVVVANYESNSVWSFTKGAYERISQLCLPASVPLDYTRVTQSLAADGCYVLAAGFRLLGNSLSDFDPVLSKREDLEQSLTCLGLIAFRNELKPTSASALAALRDGDIRSVIVTGDNEFTALYIAEQSGLIGPDAKLYVARGENENKVVWTDENGNAIAEPSIDSETSTHTEIVLTASAFRILERAGELDRILYYVRVFARMKPFDKVACVEMFMKQSIVGMCGDGGNDCGALRAAHAGVALSDAEAAVVSPFSSKNHSIWVVVDLIRHGRATLANSFASYKAMVMLGQICAWCQVVLYSYPVSFSANAWLAFEFVSVLIPFALTLSKPHSVLAARRPTFSLVGPTVLFSIIGQLLINVAFLIVALAMMSSTPGYVRWNPNYPDGTPIPLYRWQDLNLNWEQGVIFIMMIFQIINSCASMNFGTVFREHFWKNWTLMASWIFCNAVVVLVLVIPGSFSCLLSVNCAKTGTAFPESLQDELGVLCVFNWLALFAWERVVVVGPVASYLRKATPRSRYIPL